MATFTKYQDTVQQFWTAIHNLTAAGHTVKVALHSDAPVVATDDELADLTQVTGTGYTAGGEDTQNDMTETSGTATWTGVDVVWTAGASNWGAARYVSAHNDTSTTDKLLGSWDYGSNFTLLSGETFTVDFGASVATLT
jgi:hypothetical protein